MKLNEVESLEHLERLGSVGDLKNELERIVHPLKIQADTYKKLYEVIVLLKANWLDFVSGPFVSETAEYVFYLTKLDGEQRNDALGITDEVLEDKAKAKIWYKKIAQKVHPDKGGSDHAFTVLREIYEVVVHGDFGDEDEQG
jgi:hypothetical protein